MESTGRTSMRISALRVYYRALLPLAERQKLLNEGGTNPFASQERVQE
jgi:hypothetical protein